MEYTSQQLLRPEQTLDMILDALEDLVQYELAVVMTFDGNDTLKVSKVKGELYTPELDGYTISLSQRRDIARLIEKKETYLFAEDEPHLDTYYDVIDMPNNHSCLISPLYLQDELIGILTLDHRMCNVYSPRIVKFIETLSKLISVNLAQSTAASRLYSENQHLIRERNNLMKYSAGALSQLVGTSPPWRLVLDDIKLVAGTAAPVLIQGETGTGKEMAARAVHQLSSRAAGPFVAVNCSSLTASLVESELFGHERGAFTGAEARRKGRFELAHGGTLFLDEIADLPPEIQPKLLRVLQEGTFERVGGETTVSADIRLIAASNVGLFEAVEAGKFREDLYYRLSVFPIYLPPLRERQQDIMLLAEHFLAEIRGRTGYRSTRFSEKAVESLQQRMWPGNVRELKNAVERAALLSRGGIIRPEHFQVSNVPAGSRYQHVSVPSGKPRDLDSALQQHIEETLRYTRGRIYGKGGAAEILQVKPSTLQSKIKRLGIRLEEFR